MQTTPLHTVPLTDDLFRYNTRLTVDATLAKMKTLALNESGGRTSPAGRKLLAGDANGNGGYAWHLLCAKLRELTRGEACDFCGAGCDTEQARDEAGALLTLCEGCWDSYPGFLTPERWHEDDDAEQWTVWDDEDLSDPLRDR